MKALRLMRFILPEHRVSLAAVEIIPSGEAP